MGRHFVTCEPQDRRSARRLSSIIAVAALVGAGLVAVTMTQASASAPVGAISTTTNVSAPSGNGACVHGSATSDPTNCNLFADPGDVWLSGLTNLGDGSYFFAVLNPGGQNDPNDGADGNLSTSESVGDRTFTLAGGAVTNFGTHLFYNNKIQLAPFDVSSNPGGVYIMAVCSAASLPVDPSNCKYDAFKVGEGSPQDGLNAPSAEKTATPTHDRKVHWDIAKSVDHSLFNQLTSATVNYTVTATKTVDYDTFGLTGTITITNDNNQSLDVTVADNGLDPVLTGSTCSLLDSSNQPVVGSVVLTVDAKDVITDDPGTVSVNYACTFANAPDATSYTNTATVTYNLGNGDEHLDFASIPFDFPAATLASDSDPESTTVTDAFDGGAAALLTDAFTGPTGVISASHTFSYSRTIFNSNCHTYPNTATLVANGDTAGASVRFCGPNNGGLTMGWWQNKNGQSLITQNLVGACGTVNGYLPTTFAHGKLTYLPDAYTAYKAKGVDFTTGYQYDSTKCVGPPTSNKSYLPVFDLNVFTAASASGTGTMMVEGQWLTTALDTASYPLPAVYTPGKPALSPSLGVKMPTALQTGFGLAACDTISNLLTQAAGQYASYASSKAAVTSALITTLNAINNNQAQTC
jgi:hypothetical protein